MKSKFKPYIRRANGRERSSDLRCCIRLAYYAELSAKTGRVYYVMVQRGFPNDVMVVGNSKRDIKESLLVFGRSRDFWRWANRVKNMAKGGA